MRTVPILAAAAAVLAPKAQSLANSTESPGSMFWPGISNLDLTMPWHKPMARDVEMRAASDAFVKVTTNNAKCVDVAGGKAVNSAHVQLWDCTGGGNQGFKINGHMIQTENNQCLDVPNGNGYNGAALQVYNCDAYNANQNWEIVGSNIRWYGHNLCLDVKDGIFGNGTPLQLWACYLGSPNQQFTWGASTNAPTTTTVSSGNFGGFPMISWQAFINLHPQMNWFADAFVQAGAQTSIAPQLLGAIALQESSGNPNPTNGAGLMQFTDLNAWQRFAGPNTQRSNPWDAVWAGARYMRALLDQENQDLGKALRDYNGPIGQGGNPAYIADIQNWMKGSLVYGAGT